MEGPGNHPWAGTGGFTRILTEGPEVDPPLATGLVKSNRLDLRRVPDRSGITPWTRGLPTKKTGEVIAFASVPATEMSR
jgi:hypothetical protein